MNYAALLLLLAVAKFKKTQLRTALFHRFYLLPKTMFLVDGLGALLSGVLLLGLIVPFESVFGLSASLAYGLAIPAFFMMVYSFTCYTMMPRLWPRYLLLIALANLAYCCATVIVIRHQYAVLSAWGIAYFVGEISIVLGVVGLEYLVLLHRTKHNQPNP